MVPARMNRPTVRSVSAPPHRAIPLTVALLLLGVLAGGCGDAGPSDDLDARGAVELESALAACGPDPSSSDLLVDTIATGLDVPWDVAFLPDGRGLVTERSGRIRVIGAEGLVDRPWASLEVHDRDEAGLTGIDVSASGSAPAVYVVHAYRNDPASAVADLFARAQRRILRTLDPERGHPTTLRVIRFPIRPDGSAGAPETVVSGVPTFQLHGVGTLRFGPDSAMYVTNGDGADPGVAQRRSSLRGKILRYRPDGTTPADNPYPGSPVWAEGLRAVQGLDWDAASGTLMAIDHGPSGLPSEGRRTDRDELNVVPSGSNLGWPIVTGRTEGGPWTSAIASWTPAIAPAGLVLYDGPHEAWRGHAFITGLRGASLRKVDLDRSGETPTAVCEHTLLESTWGRLRLVREAPDGSLWVGTSNRDRRGTPRDRDDVILRIRPSDG